jgi:SnoaL-like domain
MNDILKIVLAWHEALNTGDVDRLVTLSSSNIELVGPRGSAYGREELRTWMTRAGLSLKPLDAYAKQNTVVVYQKGEWQQDGKVASHANVASVFKIVDDQITYIARFDTLADALAHAKLSVSDLVF